MFFTQIIKKIRKAKFIHKNVETRHTEGPESGALERSDALHPAHYFTAARAKELKRTFGNVVDVESITNIN